MKVAVLGLDCATPALVFDRFRDKLPNLGRLAQEGAWGSLESCHPPITVPAWSSMMSGFDPGELGIYGFRNRKDHSYDRYAIANAETVKVDRVWDVLSREGHQVILLGVPQTYPIRPINGFVVSDFLTPSTASVYTYPSSLKHEIERVADGYVFDVENFRSEDKTALLDRIYAKTRKHFRVAKHLVSTKPWDFFMMVEMGVDRIHHGFWSYMDATHRMYRAGNDFEHAIMEYYQYVDHEVGEVLDLFPRDTAVFVVSDHGARKLEGGFCFNEWLIQQNYLALDRYPAEKTPIASAPVDWARTIAWGDGGYYGRLFVNVKGREPNGIVEGRDYEKVRDELIAAIGTTVDEEGRSLGSRAYRPEELYRRVEGVAPDLIVYFGDLSWRSVGSVGMRKLHTFENDTGPDEANHDWRGVFIMNRFGCDRSGQATGHVEGLELRDVGAMVRRLFGGTLVP
jgi:predicted AlkP superfamily phosphohydrolase/phosphomutase